MNAASSLEQTALVRVAVDKWRGALHHHCADDVAEEVPVALEYNGISHAVMLASPHDLEDFALGFSLSEGILQHPCELFDCDISTGEHGVLMQISIAAGPFAALKGRRRTLAGRTGCGLCGAETLQQAIRHPAPVASSAAFSAEAIHAGMAAMQARQRLQQHTGATHGAAWLTPSGELALVREDIGRHNALDKLIGAIARRQLDVSLGAALITSRASYEMVQKAATVGIGFMAAISAPTSLAVRLADAANVTLLGFVRAPGHVVYAGAHRLVVA